MSEQTTETSSPATAVDVRDQQYVPPAVAWEETFDPVAQTISDCEQNPGLPGC